MVLPTWIKVPSPGSVPQSRSISPVASDQTHSPFVNAFMSVFSFTVKDIVFDHMNYKVLCNSDGQIKTVTVTFDVMEMFR